MDEAETQYRLMQLLGEDGFEQMVRYPPFWFATHQIRVWRSQVHTFWRASGQKWEGRERAMLLNGVSINDVETLLTACPGGTRWHRAAVRVARKFPNPLTNPPARRAFAIRLRESEMAREALLESLVVGGVYMAFSEADTPQRIRLGRCYLMTPRGAVAHIKPNAGKRLGLFNVVGWIIKETRNAIKADLQDLPYPDHGPEDPLDKALPVEPGFEWPQIDDDSDSLPEEESHDPHIVLDRLREVLSERELEVFGHLENDPGTTRVAIAERMGVTASTVRVLLHRIRRKLKEVCSVTM